MKTPAQMINSKRRAEFLGDRETEGLKLKQKNGITNESMTSPGNMENTKEYSRKLANRTKDKYDNKQTNRVK